MREKIKIIPHQGQQGFDIPFLNKAFISVPDVPGGYIISCGCGAGKTEACKSIIRTYHDNGILYCVDTIDECTRMYQWIIEELIDKDHVLKKSDVLMVHSGVDISWIQKHPEEILSKQVVLLTHIRLFTDIIDYYVSFNPKQKHTPFSGDFKELMGRPDLRQYILIDETPMFLRPFATVSPLVLGCLSVPQGGSFSLLPQGKIEKAYSVFVTGTNDALYKSVNNSNKIKERLAFSLIRKHYKAWLTDTKKGMEFYFYPSDLIQNGQNSHVIIFEGVADCLLRTAKGFRLLDYQKKYDCSLLFHQFQFVLKRNSSVPNETQIQGFIQEIAQILTTTSGKTLIVVWKDFHQDPQVDVSSKSSEWRDKVRERLERCGFKDFTVTYYGASDTKSTNCYSGYTNIILCGKWGIKNAGRLNEAFNASMTGEDLCFWYFVQLLSRIGIRQHRGGIFHCYYSSDINPYLIVSLNDYINKNKFKVYQSKSSLKKTQLQNIPLWQKKVIAVNREGSKYVKDIENLVLIDNSLIDTIEKGNSKVMSVTLDNLWGVFPKGTKKRKRAYNGLVKFLGLMNITLNIS